MAKFLSDEWFRKVRELAAAAGDLGEQGPLKDLAINMNVIFDDRTGRVVHMVAGLFYLGKHPNAPVTMTVTAAVAKKMFIDFDQSVAMAAFQAGQLQVEGDITKLMALQSARPSPATRKLLEDVQKITD